MRMNKPCSCIKESRYKHTRMNVEENVSILYISKRLTCGEETPARGVFPHLCHIGGEGLCAHAPRGKGGEKEENLKTTYLTKRTNLREEGGKRKML